jgi:hypothetical protein
MREDTWTGWIYLGGRWFLAAKGDSIGECCRRLTKAADQEKVPDTRCCLTRGSAPVGPPPQMQKAVGSKQEAVNTRKGR